MTEPMNPNCEAALVPVELSLYELEILRQAVPEFLRNTTMDADQELLQRAALIIDKITRA